MVKTHITVHATMTPPDTTLTGRDMDFRARQHGYTSAAYHYILRRSGFLDIGRRTSEPSIMDGSLSDCALSICLVGGVDKYNHPAENTFTDSQLVALRRLVGDIKANMPDAIVVSVCPSLSQRRLMEILDDTPKIQGNEFGRGGKEMPLHALHPGKPRRRTLHASVDNVGTPAGQDG
jgi:hypothetical protein